MQHAAIGMNGVHIDAIAQRIFLHQQPLAVRVASVQQVYLEPVGAVLESERGIAIGKGLEFARLKMIADRRQVVIAGQVMVVARMRCQRLLRNRGIKQQGCLGMGAGGDRAQHGQQALQEPAFKPLHPFPLDAPRPAVPGLLPSLRPPASQVRHVAVTPCRFH